uniref:Uncharacterized protein n=1 Tax=Tanacetum cinerariifolium TaxID=118510 RepID=A0A6L2JYQ5_TANCI|nr:hypothetical protein [Tanacetum cinerariifolium]
MVGLLVLFSALKPFENIDQEQRLAKKNELKARETLLMALPDKHQLKFNFHKDAKSLMETIEKRFGVNVAHSIFTDSSKAKVSTLPNVDSLSDAVIYSFFASQSNSPQLDNEDLKQINLDDLKEMDLKWQMDMLTMRARRFLKRTGKKSRWNADHQGTTGTKKLLEELSQWRYLLQMLWCLHVMQLVAMIGVFKLTKNLLIIPLRHTPHQAHQVLQDQIKRKSQLDVLSYKTGLESVKARLVVYQKNETVFEEDIKLVKLDVMLRDNALTELRKKFEKAEKERNDLKLTLDKFQTLSKNLKNDRYKIGEGYHVVPPLYTRAFLPSKPDLVFTDDPNASELVANVFNVKFSTNKPSKDMSKTHRPVAPIIEDWISDSENETKIEFVPKQIEPSFVTSTEHVKSSRKSVKKGNPQQALKYKGVIDSGFSSHMTRNISFLLDFEELDRGYVAFGGNPKGGKISGKGKIKTEKLDFDDVYFVKELKFNLFSVSQMCDKKNSVLFTNIECVVLPSDNKLPDENHVLLRVSRENKMYNVDLKNVFLQEGNLVRGLPSKIFKDNHTCVACQKGKQHKASYDDVADAAFDVKENENDVHVYANESDKSDNKKHNEKAKRDDKGKSPVDSLIGVRDLRAEFEEFSFNSSNRVTAVRAPVNAVGPNPTNSINNFNTASPSVNVVSLNFRIARKSSFMDPSKYPDDPDMHALEDIIYSNDEEDVGAEADLSNLETNIPVNPIPTTRVHKDHHVNQIIGDLILAPQTRSMTKMVKEQGGLHQINDEYFTCMFACFFLKKNLRKYFKHSKIQVGLKPCKRSVYNLNCKKGHTQEEGINYNEVFAPVARIEAIWLFLAYASFMGFMVVKAVYGLHQAPRAWYETLANYLLENGFQRRKIDQNLFIKKQKGDILLVQVYVDDIIFGSTNKELSKAFEKLMKDKFQMNVKSASNPIKTEKPLLKDPDGEDVDVCIYSDYARASLDRKSTIGGCQFLGCRLISWKCKKKTVVATLSTEAEYVAAASCCAQVLWIQNQLLDYGVNTAGVQLNTVS